MQICHKSVKTITDPISARIVALDRQNSHLVHYAIEQRSHIIEIDTRPDSLAIWSAILSRKSAKTGFGDNFIWVKSFLVPQ